MPLIIFALLLVSCGKEKKDFGISNKGYTRSWKRVKSEIEKCILVCANCHRELHAKMAALNGNIKVKSG